MKKSFHLTLCLLLVLAGVAVLLYSRSSPPLPSRLTVSGEEQPHSQSESTTDTPPPPEVHSGEEVKVIDQGKTDFTSPENIEQTEQGKIGSLCIPDIALDVGVYEADDEMEAMELGVAHFGHTSVWEGNVGLSAHNVNLDGTDGHFKDLHTLKKGSTIRYTTSLGEREYTVESIETIADTDWSYLGMSSEHKLTLITCITGEANKRLMVQAVMK